MYYRLVNSKSGKCETNDDIARVVVCEKMGWDYQTYEAQPFYFTEQLFIKWGIENRKRERDEKELKRKSRRR